MEDELCSKVVSWTLLNYSYESYGEEFMKGMATTRYSELLQEKKERLQGAGAGAGAAGEVSSERGEEDRSTRMENTIEILKNKLTRLESQIVEGEARIGRMNKTIKKLMKIAGQDKKSRKRQRADSL